MDLHKEIIKPIEIPLQEFGRQYDTVSISGISLLDKVTSYLSTTRGKQIRPTLLFLVAGAHGKITEKTIRTGLAIELLHITSLVHDDVVDESSMRRGKKTINDIWGNKIAVLAGDYLYALVLKILVEIDNKKILEIISSVAEKMGKGEMLQQQTSIEFDLSEVHYYEIIRKKTASLFSACCLIGAITSQASEENQQKMAEFGEHLGIAFQIQDDILDYSRDVNTGKLFGNDIRENKVTLPLIHFFSTAPAEDCEKVKRIFTQKEVTESDIALIIDKVTEFGGLEFAHRRASDFIEKAMKLLVTLPESEYKTSLIRLVTETTTRKK